MGERWGLGWCGGCIVRFNVSRIMVQPVNRQTQVKTLPSCNFVEISMRQIVITVEEEHTIQTDLLVYTRFHSINILKVIAKKQVSKHTQTF